MEKDVTMNCPGCGKKMDVITKTQVTTYVCTNKGCTNKHAVVPLSIFGIT